MFWGSASLFCCYSSGGWQTRTGSIRPIFLPSLTQVVSRLHQLAMDGTLVA
ncbi:hypothetical protein P4S72_12375 [Vibrio sp. PP-XX7]